MPQQTTIQWDTPGKVLEVDSSGQLSTAPNPVKDGTVEITEEGKSFYLKDFETGPTAGIPVDANLAVYLIKQLFDKLETPPGGITVEKWMKSLLYNSRAVTIDKNVLMKTISQPGCEGLRLYLCLKPNEEIIDPGDPEYILSLVTVGVDKDGKDLGYEFDGAVADDIAENDIFKVKTKSLASEYNYPPPARTFTKTSAEKTYILGGYAWGNKY